MPYFVSFYFGIFFLPRVQLRRYERDTPGTTLAYKKMTPGLSIMEQKIWKNVYHFTCPTDPTLYIYIMGRDCTDLLSLGYLSLLHGTLCNLVELSF